MSGTLLERLQQKVDAELEQYRSGLLSQGAQAVMDNAYELVIKSELAVLLESACLSKQQVRALLDQENERWENDHVAIGDLLCDTIYTAGNDAHRERLTKSKQRRKEEAR